MSKFDKFIYTVEDDTKSKNHIEDEHRMDGPNGLDQLVEITDQEMLDAGFILDEDGDWVKGPNYKEYAPTDDDWDEDDEDYPVETEEPRPKQKFFAQNGRETYVEHVCSHNSIEDDNYVNLSLLKAQNALDDEYKDRVVLGESDLLRATQAIEQDLVNQYILAVRNGDFVEARRIISESEERRIRNELQLAFVTFFTLLTPIYAQQLFRERAAEFEKQGVFAMSNEIERQIKEQANKGADSHIKTITDDLDEAVRRAVQNEIEGALIDLVAKEVQTQNPNVLKRLPTNPNQEDIVKEVKKGTFSQKDNPLYKRARQLAREGNGLDSITRALRKEYDNISRNRARTIARHETNRVFNMAQYQADLQFLKETNLLDNAYKIMKNRADDPCPICAKVIEDSRANPIPFTQNFVNKGEGFKVKYTTKAGNEGTMKLNANYEAISAGNIHVNCRCEYVLLIKQADGSFLNRLDNVVYNYSPSQARDKDGKWTDGGSGGGFRDYENPNFYAMEKVYGKQALDNDMYTKEEQMAINGYGYSDYKTINPMMRGVEPMTGEYYPKAIETIKNAPKLKLKENTYLWRGGRMDAKLDVGDTITDKAFVSTSFAKSVASDFARFQGTGKNKYLFQIAAKKGTEGIYIGHDETEWLLNSNSSFKVNSMSEPDENGVITVGVDYGE